MPRMHVPAEVTAQICQYTDYDDLQSLCDAVGGITIDQAIYHRFDPRVYFKKLTPNPDKLMSAMRECAAVLSGSRAAGFFYPTTITEDSDWDFYCTSCQVSATKFGLVLSEMGVKWEKRTFRRSLDRTYGDTFQMLHGKLDNQKIQLIWLTNPGDTTFNTIATFHSSVVQCFISGWCAVSMYHNVSAKKKMFSWYLDPIITPSKAQAAPACVAKYVSRGFEVIPYSTAAIGTVPLEGVSLGWNPRCISDKGSLVIDFKSHLNYKDTKESIMHDAAVEEIRSIRWAECVEHNEDGGVLGMRLRVTPKACMNWTLYRSLQGNSTKDSLSQLASEEAGEIDEPRMTTILKFDGRSETITWMPPIPGASGGKSVLKKTNLPPV